MNKLLLIILLVFSVYTFAEDCMPKERIQNYKSIEAKLKKMHLLLPALKPDDKKFYEEVNANLYKQPAKYKRYLSENDYVIYSNTILIENHLYWVNLAIQGLESEDFDVETYAFSRLMIGGVKDVKWLDSFSDSLYMTDKGIVLSDYALLAKNISVDYGTVALCMAEHYESVL